MAKWPHKSVFPLNQEELDRFLSGFQAGAPSACWPWCRSTNSTGYGQIMVKGGMRLAHRISWAVHHARDIPRPGVICHTCDNPPCVNPAHLFLGDQRANHWDMRSKGRESLPPRHEGERHPMAKLTNAQMAEIGNSAEKPSILAARYGVSSDRVNVLKRKHGNAVGKGYVYRP